MINTPCTHQFLKPVLLLLGMSLLSGCADTPGFRRDVQFKSTSSAPATPSIVQAYKDIADEMIADATEVASMDRTLHGTRPPIAAAPPAPMPGTVSFDRYQSLYFKVYKVEVVDQYQMPVSLNYDDHLLVTPNDAVHEWSNRLRPTGGVNKLQVVITDARVTPASGDPKRYDASLAIEMRICSRDGTVLARVTTSAMQSAMVGENRNAALNAMLLKLIDNANGELESKMAQHFSPYIDRKTV